jgi:predicted dienelactone hydrolase
MHRHRNSTSIGQECSAARRLRAGLVVPLTAVRTAPLAALLTALLVACTTQPSPPPGRSEARVREFAAKGYSAVEQVAVTTSAHSWLLAGRLVKLNLAEPQRPGAAPLVLYLPGLGESGNAGATWRAAWASAGYAVLSVQPLDDDALAWTSELARSGEFRTLGRQRYAAANVQGRLRALFDVTDEAQRRAAAGEAAWQRIDWSHVAVAGFDLGAYTAMALAGEHVTGTDTADGRLKIRAAIALSPFVSLAAGALDSRYLDIRTPVLSVTSDVDGDVLGLVDSAALRSAPFERMPGPDKYLLSLQGVPHAGFGGNPQTAAARPSGGQAERAQEARPKSDGDGTGQSRRSGRPKGTGEAAKAPAAGADRTAGEPMAPRAVDADSMQLRMIAAQGVSTAFLDAYVRDDPLARAWLSDHAARWLGASGTLRRK